MKLAQHAPDLQLLNKPGPSPAVVDLTEQAERQTGNKEKIIMIANHSIVKETNRENKQWDSRR